MDRRKFLRSTAAVSAVLATNPLRFCTPTKQLARTEIGLQVYTLRDQLKTDLEGTLRKVAETGYNHVELYGYREGSYFGKPVKKMHQFLNGLGLKVHSSHIPTGAAEPNLKGTVTNDFERAVADAKIMGQSYLVCPYLADFERRSIDDYKRLAATFNRAGEICKQYGIQFCYHNHDFEFFDFNGQIPYDILLAETDPELMQMELDIYWINRAGYNHLDYFNRAPGRYPLWHVKDMEDSPEKAFTEVGNGVIPWKEAFAARQNAGMRYFFVEQDVCKRPPLESIAISYQYLQSIPLQ